MANPRCFKCGKFTTPKARYCPYCGLALVDQMDVALAVEKAFHPSSASLLHEMDLMDATEIVSIVRRVDDDMLVDSGDLDPDTTISLLCRGLFMALASEMNGSLIAEMDGEEDDED